MFGSAETIIQVADRRLTVLPAPDSSALLVSGCAFGPRASLLGKAQETSSHAVR